MTATKASGSPAGLLGDKVAFLMGAGRGIGAGSTANAGGDLHELAGRVPVLDRRGP